MTIQPPVEERHFPISAGIFFGLGLGGFFDGIVLHQLLQWHHMLSSWYPVTSIDNLELNTRWDGNLPQRDLCVCGDRPVPALAHRAAQAPLLVEQTARRLHAARFRRVQRRRRRDRPPPPGIHHVNETVDPSYRLYWDLAFQAWGAGMLVAGWILLKQGKRESESQVRRSGA